jgi:hypothetical protein
MFGLGRAVSTPSEGAPRHSRAVPASAISIEGRTSWHPPDHTVEAGSHGKKD